MNVSLSTQRPDIILVWNIVLIHLLITNLQKQTHTNTMNKSRTIVNVDCLNNKSIWEQSPYGV